MLKDARRKDISYPFALHFLVPLPQITPAWPSHSISFLLIFSKIQTNNGLLSGRASPTIVPSDLGNCLSHLVLGLATKLHTLVPSPTTSLNGLIHNILLGYFVVTSKALHEFGEGRVAGHVDGGEVDVLRGGALPRGAFGFEDVDLGMLGGEEVVVAGLAARPPG